MTFSDQAALARRALLGSAATFALFAGSTAAQAQCTNNNGLNLNALIPFATGSAVSSIITTVGTVNSASLAQSSAYVGTPGNAGPNQQGGGVWTRGIVGSVETNANTITTATAPFSGSDSCHTTTKQDYSGVQLGADLARLNFGGGSNLHVGLTAGYFDVTSKDRTPGQGTFGADAQIPFAGLYAALSAGAFSFDAQVRSDFIQMSLTDVTQGVSSQSLDAKTFAFLWNASYLFNMGSNWFVRPSVGGVWSRTEIDPLNVAGTFIAFPGTVSINDIESLLGRASVTIGTTVDAGRVVWQPFATFSAFHEFAGSVKTDMTAIGLDATSTTSRVGTYYHIGGGVAGTIVDTGWLAYAKVDYLTGDNIDAWSVNAGLRYQFAPGGARAGGLKDSGDAPAVAAYNWSGLYVGGFGGSVKSIAEWEDVTGTTQPKNAGYLLGGQVGYNFQRGMLLIGAEADYGFSDAEGGRSCPNPVGNAFFFTCRSELSNLGFLGGRLGFVWDRALIYGKAGAAFGETTLQTVQNVTKFTGSQTATLWGWGAGAGFEFALTDRWSAKAEYMHFDLGSHNYVFDPDGTGDVTFHGKTSGDTVRIGVNYHFGK